MSVNYR